MDEDLDRVKDQLEELDDALEKMKEGRTASPDRSDDRKRDGPSEETHGESRNPARTGDLADETTNVREDRDDQIEDPEPVEDSQEGKNDNPHPSPLERFRDKLDHGHEAADNEHYREAQNIYRSLIQEYRGLKHRDKLTDEDEKRLHTLYEKVDRAKE